jgi:hypothetical protein
VDGSNRCDGCGCSVKSSAIIFLLCRHVDGSNRCDGCGCSVKSSAIIFLLCRHVDGSNRCDGCSWSVNLEPFSVYCVGMWMVLINVMIVAGQSVRQPATL